MDTAIKHIVEECSLSENYSTLSNATEKLIEQSYNCLSISKYDIDCIILDFKSFKFVAILIKKSLVQNPITELIFVINT